MYKNVVIGQERIGIFCGSFNPIHLGHTALLAAAMVQLDLTGAVLVPVNDDYWKPGCRYESARHRIQMCALAAEELPNVCVSDLEARTPGTAYTADTVACLARAYPNARFFLLLGSDTARYVHHWTRFERLKELVTFVLAQRDPSEAPVGQSFTDQGADWMLLCWTPHPISSSAVRKELRERGRAEGLNGRVLKYIQANSLYGTEAFQF